MPVNRGEIQLLPLSPKPPRFWACILRTNSRTGANTGRAGFCYRVLSDLTSEHPNQATTTPDGYFATTRWTVVIAAGRGSTPQSDLALEELCRTYWYPLYAYIRRHGHTREDAEDLTQSFFARFLARNYLEGLRNEQGKFRAFLLA